KIRLSRSRNEPGSARMPLDGVVASVASDENALEPTPIELADDCNPRDPSGKSLQDQASRAGVQISHDHTHGPRLTGSGRCRNRRSAKGNPTLVQRGRNYARWTREPPTIASRAS